MNKKELKEKSKEIGELIFVCKFKDIGDITGQAYKLGLYNSSTDELVKVVSSWCFEKMSESLEELKKQKLQKKKK